MAEGSKSAEKNKDEILKKLEAAFSQLTDVKDLACSAGGFGGFHLLVF